MPAGAAARGLPTVPRLIPVPSPGTQTNDLGEFRISGLPAGEYFVAVSPRSMATFGPAASSPVRDRKTARTTLPTTYYPGTIDQGAAQPIAVAAGAEVGNIFLTLQAVPAYRVSGIVVDEEGKPVRYRALYTTGYTEAWRFPAPPPPRQGPPPPPANR